MIYLDSCIVISAIEDPGPFGNLVRERLSASDHQLVISELVKMECLVGCEQRADLSLRDEYLEFFDTLPSVEMLEDCYFRAAELRGRKSLKAVDALHVSVAQLAGCSYFWTDDSRLANSMPGFAVNLRTDG